MVALVAAVVTVVVSGSRSEPATAAPAVHLGPQGAVPQFVAKCGFSHAADDDPIVHPGMAGMSHRHDFFGNRSTDSTSTLASMLGQPTSCTRRLDTAAYWAPSLFDHESRSRSGPSPTTGPPLGRPGGAADVPCGMMMVAGSKATEAQAVEVAAWTCGTSSDLGTVPPVCPAGAPLRVRITFPDCWDGVHADVEDHRSHTARSGGGRCPESHPVVIPQLTLEVRYPISGEGHDLSLSSGPVTTAHADFLNAWDQRELEDQVNLCLRRSLVCNVASNRAEDEPQSLPS
jgi:hypothetical protein